MISSEEGILVFKALKKEKVSTELKIIPWAGMGLGMFLKDSQWTLVGSFGSKDESLSREKNRNVPMMPRAWERPWG